MALRPAVLSLCSGGGGLDLGVCLAWERITGTWPRVVGYVEREAFAAATLVAGMEAQALDHAPIWDDLATFDGRPWRGKVDIVTAGFPCQPFSVAGQRKGIEDERWLWPHVARIVGEVGPAVAFLENVPGLLTAGFGYVLGSLAEMGLNAEWGCFSAAEVDASHLRERLFILAYSPRLGRGPWWPQSTREQGRSDVAQCSSAMAHSLRKGLSLPWGCGQGKNKTELRGVFPPPPDSPQWAEVSPALEPAIRGMAHGVAQRVDQLRMLGNGVVPLAAAYAFCSLWADAMSWAQEAA